MVRRRLDGVTNRVSRGGRITVDDSFIGKVCDGCNLETTRVFLRKQRLIRDCIVSWDFLVPLKSYILVNFSSKK